MHSNWAEEDAILSNPASQPLEKTTFNSLMETWTEEMATANVDTRTDWSPAPAMELLGNWAEEDPLAGNFASRSTEHSILDRLMDVWTEEVDIVSKATEPQMPHAAPFNSAASPEVMFAVLQ